LAAVFFVEAFLAEVFFAGVFFVDAFFVEAFFLVVAMASPPLDRLVLAKTLAP